MSEWKARRFWKEATVVPEGNGYSIRLDGRGVKTPAKSALIVPTHALAAAIAAEWAAQGEEIDPLTMPYTRSANAALDKVTPQQSEVAELIAAYGDSDLLCYRADTPAELAARQAAGWDPVLGWAARDLGAKLSAQSGVIHVPQDSAAVERLSARVRAFDPFTLTGLHDLVSLSGSLVLGLAVLDKHLDPARAWSLSRIDEDWQTEQWGEDEEARAAAEIKQTAFFHAAHFCDICFP